MKELHFETIDSTCKYLDEHYPELEDLTFVSADYQSAGIGRNARNWVAPKGENLLFSILLKRDNLSTMFPYFSLLSAKVVLEEVSKYGVKDLSIKWPNDVYAGDKKLCGILLTGSLPNYLEAGIGINVNQTHFEGPFRILPTSLALEIGHPVDILELKASLFSSLISQVNHFNPEEIVRFVSQHNYLLNRQISYFQNNLQKEAKVIGISKECCLLVEKKGQQEALFSGEVSLIQEKE